MSDSLLQQAIAAARAGRRDLARQMLSTVVQRDPTNEQAWLWLSGVVDEPARSAYCLQRVLAINPANAQAQAGLEWAMRQSSASVAPPASAAPPADESGGDSLLALLREPAPAASRAPEPPAGVPNPPSALPPSTPTGYPPAPEPPAAQLPPAPGSEPADPLLALLSPAAPAQPAAPAPLPALRNELPEPRRSVTGPTMPIAAEPPGLTFAADPVGRETMERVGPQPTLSETLGYMLLLGAVVGLNTTVWIGPGAEVRSLGSSMLVAALAALLFAIALLPAWAAMLATLVMLTRGVLQRAEAVDAVTAALTPGFLLAAAFLSGVARQLVPALDPLLAALQLLLAAAALLAIPVALYTRLRRHAALAQRSPLLPVLAATMAALLLGSAAGLLVSSIVRRL